MSDAQAHKNKVTWEIESTHPEMVEEFRTKMREIVDPELGLDIIQLGLVRDVRVQEKDAQIDMLLTTPFCPYGPAMLETTRKKAEEVLARPTTIELNMEMWDFSMMEEGAAADWGFY
jgi:metal-sulfur cluster biosynthetic enzyme